MLGIKKSYRICLRHSILPILLLCTSMSLYADPTPQPVITPTDTIQPEFNLKQANKTFDQLNLKLSVEERNIEHLETAIATLNQLIKDANTYINFNQKKLSELENLAKETGQSKDKEAEPTKKSVKTGADSVYLDQEQKKISDKIAQSRLFIIRAQEAIDTYQIVVAKIKQKQVLTLGSPLWTLVDRLQNDPSQTVIALPDKIETPTFSTELWYKLCGIALLCILVSTLIIRRIKLHKLTRKLLRVKHIRTRDGVLLFLCLFGTVVSLYCIKILSSQNNASTILISALILIVSGYFWALAFINVIFKSIIVSATFYWYSLDCHFFKNLLIFFLTYYTISQIADLLIQTLTIPGLLWQLIQIVFHTGVVITAIGFFVYFCHSHQHIHFIQAHTLFLQWSIALLFLACGTLNILGYHELAIHLTYTIITTFITLFAMFLLLYAIKNIYQLCTEPGPTHRYLLHLFGYKPNQIISEFVILKISLQIIVLCTGFYFIGQSSGYGSYYINSVYTQLLHGIPFANFTFYPTRIMAGFIVFCILYLFFRSFSTKLSHHAEFEEGEETQVAIASILTYIGFTCALVTALLISGIDFTGLAIVAGALSVGIGLGLQSIVNNFVSGIILLIEKPIKPGDRISIEGLEGVVKKIRVRSTQITTTAREDVIIPNSDLITRAVTNYMYTDQYLSICCEVGVTYDCDPMQVKKLLLQAVLEHGEIVKSARAKPNVLFQQFGESAMIFQVWFLIKDGNKKANVRSDVNFTIDRLFREHQIKIAHPQRDITMRTV
ncbi:MAG: mechanosensitive ion channel [Legionellales bacterium]|nr:mechanosensitive ion channel [Legionellales bacterium]